MKLQDLSHLGQRLKSEYLLSFKDNDIRLPQAVVDNMKQFDNSPIVYKSYNFIVESSSGLKIFYPNQVIYIAAYFTEYYEELEKYKEQIISVGNLSSDEIKSCRDNRNAAHDLVFSYRFINTDNDDKELLVKFLSDYQWWYGGKTIDRADYFVSPILSLANLVNASHGFVADICRCLSKNAVALHAIKDAIHGNLDNYYIKPDVSLSKESLQVIYFGAPGTSKSTTIKNKVGSATQHRITFHPDTDYSNFVGCYKPTKEDGSDEITYAFVEQTFIKAYVDAWKKLVDDSDEHKEVYLIIEEINRGNCAQIFGDLFQLLDRDDDGYSDYTIEPDSDLQRHLAKMFKGTSVPENIRDGVEMQLPPNMYIWATMNTSDQSLFPIDSAFKRRWEWKYLPIKNDMNGHVIRVDARHSYDWWQFLEAINLRIEKLTELEDKQLGYWFAKPDKGKEISLERFVSKVVFYLWNDVFKDYGTDGSSPFVVKEADDKKVKLKFTSFFSPDGNAIPEVVTMFIEGLGVENLELKKADEAQAEVMPQEPQPEVSEASEPADEPYAAPQAEDTADDPDDSDNDNGAGGEDLFNSLYNR